MKRIKGMTNNNKAEERMEFNDDMVEKIISHMPLKFAIQCKVLSKKYEAVDYPSPDTYKLVTITKLVENFNCFYKFHVLSSDRSGVWREIQLRANTSISLSFYCPPIYWHNYLYWLRSDNSILGFDTKREESILIDRPQFVDQFDLNYGKTLIGHDIWLGVTRGLLTLVSIFKKSIVISTCNNSNNNWKVSHILDNFILGPRDIIKGFPVLIDCKDVYFVVKTTFAEDHLYEYDTKTNGYKKVGSVGQRC
ncbi:hypothetical protein H5410_029956 [Solanum commersonii]|uniref:Uncharacterized protein n=1 Tax=Solanum commersonii TaxID=4109 RepID=A0A9J5YED9_SOLCO|nr:hypothetical protein H5410_029956 [Solanum commersonii]